MHGRYFLLKLKTHSPIIVALIIFSFYLSIYFFQKELVTHDATRWINYGTQLVQGDLQSFKFDGASPQFSPIVWAPGYPFLIGLINKIIHDPIFSAYLVSMLMGAFLSLIVFYLTKELFNAIKHIL